MTTPKLNAPATSPASNGSVRRWLVCGHAFVPMKVQITIEADSQNTAMKAANKKLKTKIRDYLVAGSEDEGAAWGFDAADAEEIKAPND